MNKKSFTLQQLASLIEAEIIGDANHLIYGIADLDSATAEEISFFSNPRYEQKLYETKAGAVVITRDLSKSVQRALIVSDPTAAFQKLIELFMNHLPKGTGFEDGVHESAVIHKTATIEKGVNIGPNVVVGAHTIIREGTSILPGTVIGSSVQIGNSCLIHSQVVIREGTVIGNRVIIQPGAVIGSCGYGFTTDKSGKHTKLNQLGSVIIHDDVEIGAGTTIDRARFQATTIGEGSKIDNLVQIAHGVTIGKHCLIVGQVGIAGSTKIGNHVIVGGQTGISGHIEIADHVAIAARSGVSKSLLKPGKYGGQPAIEFSQNQRLQVFIRQIEKLKEEIEKLKSLLK